MALKKNHKKISNKYVVMLVDIFVSMFASMCALLILRATSWTMQGFQVFSWTWLLLSGIFTYVGIYVFKSHKVIVRYASFKSISKLFWVAFLKEMLFGICLVTGILKTYDPSFAYLTLILDALLSITFLILFRVIFISVTESFQSSYSENAAKMRMCVYGTGSKSIAMIQRFETSPHYEIVGFLTRDSDYSGRILNDKPVYYFDEDNFEQIFSRAGMECIVYATNKEADNEKSGLTRMCIQKGISILMAPSLDDITGENISADSMNSVINDNGFICDGMSGFARNVKRIADFIISAILIIIFSPLFLICYIAVKCEDGGPALFKQERIGRFGRPFNILKFRSMKMDAEAQGPALYSGDDDPRLTKVGKFLRQHHLDELPQLFNVLAGQMAFVGPRPERKFYINQIIEKDPRYGYLFQIRPGVTSYATLYNGYTDSMEKMLKRLELDLYYLRHRSWWFDLKILGMTFMSIVFGKKF